MLEKILRALGKVVCAILVTAGVLLVAGGVNHPLHPDASMATKLWITAALMILVGVSGWVALRERGNRIGATGMASQADAEEQASQGEVERGHPGGSSKEEETMQHGTVKIDDSAEGWDLHKTKGSRDRKFTQRVSFESPFPSMPNVLVGLAGFDMQTSRPKVFVTAHDVTERGFEIAVEIAAQTKLSSVAVSWLAYGTDAAAGVPSQNAAAG